MTRTPRECALDDQLHSLLTEHRFHHAPNIYMDCFDPLFCLLLAQKGGEVASKEAVASEHDEDITLHPKLVTEERVNALRYLALPKLCLPFFSSPLLCENSRGEADHEPSLSVSPPASTTETVGKKRVRGAEGDPTPPSDQFNQMVELLSAAGEVYSMPMRGDSDYLQSVEVLMALQFRATLLDKHLSTQDGVVMKNYGIDLVKHLKPCVVAMRCIVESHIQSRVSTMETSGMTLPRVVRLSRRLGLTPKETKAMVYLTVAQSGSWISLVMDHMLHPSSVALWNDMNPTELHHFMRDDRPHVHQGLVVVSEIACLPESRILLPQEAAAALSGMNTTHEQLSKLEKTTLGDLLHEEQQSNSEKQDGEKSAAGAGVSVAKAPHLSSTAAETHEAKSAEESHSDDEEQSSASDSDEAKQTSTPAPVASWVGAQEELLDKPYANDFECMEGAFHLISLLVKIRNMEGDIKEEEEHGKKKKEEAAIRGMEGKLRQEERIHASRVEATIKGGVFMPAIEALSNRFQLSELEKRILLLMVGNAISHDVLVAINGRYFMREGQRFMTVGYIIFVLCKGLQQRVEARQAFYRSSRLVSNSILSISVLDTNSTRSSFNTDLMEYVCDIDRQIVDLVMGRETESKEMVPGSTVITPTVSLEKVVLPRTLMDRVMSRVEHFSLLKECMAKSQFGVGLGDSNSGLAILFYGPSGTGKTMLAHAVAKELQKKLLLVNISAFKGAGSAAEVMRFIFREAKLRDAIIFFDECDELFANRKENQLMTTLLIEFEKYSGMILMATNAAQCFDESMNRRIALMMEFKPPDHSMRHQIWLSHIPESLKLNSDVSLERLALDYELTGGLIRNAVLAAMNNAVSREKVANPTLCMEDFEFGAKQQLRGFFMAASGTDGRASAYLTPRRRLEEFIADAATKRQVEHVANLCKSRSTLFSLWGFKEENAPDQGSIYLFHGPSGTGKSLAAEGIGYECGLSIRMCNATALLRGDGMGSSSQVATVFQEAQQLGAMVVIEESQHFFNAGGDPAMMELITYHALRHTRPVIFIVTVDPPSYVDLTHHRIPITLSIAFTLPRREHRLRMWNVAFPTGVPLDKDVDMSELSQHAISARQIERIAFQVCCKAAMMPATSRTVTMAMVTAELESEVQRDQARRSVLNMYA